MGYNIPFLYGYGMGHGTFQRLSCSIKLWIEPSKVITVPWNEFIINIINNQQGFIQHLRVNTLGAQSRKYGLEYNHTASRLLKHEAHRLANANSFTTTKTSGE